MPKVRKLYPYNYPTEKLITIRKRSETALENHRKFLPKNGAIPIGGAHIDYLIEGESLATFLRNVCQHGIEVARDKSIEEAKLIVQKWNASRKDYQVHRWENSGQSVIDWAVQLLGGVSNAKN